MATTTNPPANQPGAGAVAAPQATTTVRDVLALVLVALSAGAIGFIAMEAVQNPGNAEVDKVLTVIVGLAGTWVSTVLVFYFSKENFQAAQNAMANVVATAQRSNLAATAVRTVMINRNSIKDVKIPSGQDETGVPFKTLCDKLKAESVTRIPIFIGDVVKYVIYDASIYRFLSDRQIAGQPVDVATATLADLLAHPIDGQTVKAIVARMAFVPVTATLEDAKAALSSGSGSSVRDVFVTKSGAPTEPVEGWLTDIDIARISGS